MAVAILALGIFGSASAQVASPRVALQFGTNGLTNPLQENSNDATIARLLIDTTGSTEAIRIASLPFNLVVGNGADASSLEECQVYNEANNTVALNDADEDDTMDEGVNNISFETPLVLAANTLTTLALRCDIGELEAGGTYTVNMNTNNVSATGASTGLPALVTIRGSVVIPPVVVPPVVVPPVTPGMPTTGGEAAQNIAMLAAALLIAGLGFSSLSLKGRNG